VAVSDVLPEYIPDVFAEKPVIIKGRYTQAGRGKIIVSGRLGGEPWYEEIQVNLPAKSGNGSAIATLWAREKVEEIMRSDWMAPMRALQNANGTTQGNGKNVQRSPEQTERAIVDLALRFRLMTQYTSFVAVENRVINVGGKQVTVQVPVEMADGVSYEGIFGADKALGRARFSQPTLQGGQGLSSGGGGGGAAPPATKAALGATVEQLSDARFRYGLTLTQADNETLKKAKDEDVASLRGTLDSETEAKFLANLEPAQKERYLFLTRIDEKLRSARPGTSVEVQVWVRDVSEELVRKLKALGFKVSLTDKGLKAVFGSVDARQLKAIAQIQSVVKVLPLQG
jgi:Ca-activated chloride channel family protein